MNRKWSNLFEFFKSTLAINFAVSFFVFLFGGLIAFNYSVLTFGFALSLFFKEVNAKNEYVFYFNNTISKIQLWVYSWFFTFVFLAICSFVFNLIRKLF
ncbi:hypothetical protein DOS84_00735 [Flavobacterium aquariorum]|uniref:Uncharacterized protein n=1 Tax=Flavobacterium aquariorum TaxID=2217670 RepID=A0A2W7U1U8_9FLAO|nr:hypothetical protein DOS84_00735 [Flavobacterium aquariorum]